ncbi:FAD-dependent oxidoreductase [Streptomyces sp. NPDC059455]|uniref:FAD-dependent oxidoreductase n=1 Tax=Streptomyces sp. NPDC059455 TaxID=3346837 RepID=UPI0036C7BF06
MPTSISSKRIAIIGAGPGGLTCARILHKHGVPVTVYDQDAHEEARNQGGSLDLHEYDGQLALREAGLIEEFFELSRFEGQEMRGIDPHSGQVLARHLPEEGEAGAPEIDRGQLRRLLLRSLTPGTVRWGHTLESVTGPDDGSRTLTFSNGVTVQADLVIGADGAWSRTRRAVSQAVPVYSGVDFLEAWFDDMETRHTELAELVGEGSAMAGDADGAIFAQRNSGGHMRVYIVRRRPVDWMAQHGLTPQDTEGIRALLLKDFADWSPDVLRMITDNDGQYVDRPLFVLPAPHDWEHSATVTLLGDAAHLVPPVGVGVNVAMLDACELALAIRGSESIDEAIRAYETTMLPRSHKLALALDGRADYLLRDDDPEGMQDPSDLLR